MRIYGVYGYMSVTLDTNQQAGGKTYIKKRFFPICDVKNYPGYTESPGETSTEKHKGTSINCREKPENKADGAQKPKCTRNT